MEGTEAQNAADAVEASVILPCLRGLPRYSHVEA